MAQFFMSFYGSSGLKNMGNRIKVFNTLVDARKHALQFLRTRDRLVEKQWHNYREYGGDMPKDVVYGVRINTIKNGIVSGCGYIEKTHTSNGQVKFVWKGFTTHPEKGITINPNGTLRKGSVKKKASSTFGL